MGERLALLEHLGVAVLRLTVQRLEQPLKFEKVCAGLLVVAVVVKCDGEVELEEVVRLLPTPQLVSPSNTCRCAACKVTISIAFW